VETVSEQRCFDGVQGVYRHQSAETGTPMQFAVYQPPSSNSEHLAVLWYLSGLTCTEENFIVKAGAQRFAAEHGVILIAPDTSPRGAGIPAENDDYDFGTGAGFYVDATNPPWHKNYRMYSYITRELQEVYFGNFPGDRNRQGITGHSMGGHGALTIGLRNPDIFKSISAFSPICAPGQCAWGQKAFRGYLGEDKSCWSQYDATSLIVQGMSSGEILVDQGQDDDFLQDQLKPELLKAACSKSGQELNLRVHPGYDHSYYFISTFISDHIKFHAHRLTNS
jgi:S-formylglutathione hydrolase